MTRQTHDRPQRVADLIQREMARFLTRDFRDSRMGMVTVTHVTLSHDLLHAKVFVTVLQEDKLEITLEILNEAQGIFRNALAKKLHLRKLPHLRFVFDASILEGAKIARLLDKADIKPRDDEAE